MEFKIKKEEYKMITKTGKELRKNIIFKKNELSQKYICSLNAKDALFIEFLMSIIDAPKNINGKDLLDENGNIKKQYIKYCFHKNLYFDCIGNQKNGKNFKDFEDSVVKANSVSYFLKEKNIKNKHKIATLVKIIDKCVIDYDTGIVYIKFDESCFKFLFNINTAIKNKNIKVQKNKRVIDKNSGGFHAYEFIDEICFKSKHSYPLFNYLISYKGFKKVVLSVEDLRKVCGIEETQYPDYRHFKKRVILEAISEINKYTNFNIVILREITENYRHPIKIEFSINQKNPYEYASRIDMINKELDEKSNDKKSEDVLVPLPDYMLD